MRPYQHAQSADSIDNREGGSSTLSKLQPTHVPPLNAPGKCTFIPQPQSTKQCYFWPMCKCNCDGTEDCCIIYGKNGAKEAASKEELLYYKNQSTWTDTALKRNCYWFPYCDANVNGAL